MSLRGYFQQMFIKRPTAVESHAHCVSREQLSEATAHARDLAAQLEILRRRYEQLEQRWETAEARATEYGQRLGELRRLAMPVSLMLVEGDIEAACAVNPLLWEAVKPEAHEA